jgi:DNA-binding Xre family transcriptional regulator
MSFKNNLQQILNNKEMTLNELSEECCLSVVMLESFVSGKKLPSLSRMKQICWFLSVRIQAVWPDVEN